MMKKYVHMLALLVVGFAAGLAFVAGCGKDSSGGTQLAPNVAAAQVDCAQYEVQVLDVDEPVYAAPQRMPAGWVPFGVTNGDIAILRCVQ